MEQIDCHGLFAIDQRRKNSDARLGDAQAGGFELVAGVFQRAAGRPSRRTLRFGGCLMGGNHGRLGSYLPNVSELKIRMSKTGLFTAILRHLDLVVFATKDHRLQIAKRRPLCSLNQSHHARSGF